MEVKIACSELNADPRFCSTDRRRNSTMAEIENMDFLGTEELPIPVEGEGDSILDELQDDMSGQQQNGDKDRDKNRRLVVC